MRVIVVGGGPAGLSAALSLSAKDVSVDLLESGSLGTENSKVGVTCGTRQLAKPDVLGDRLFTDAPVERWILRRGHYAYNGTSLSGFEVEFDPEHPRTMAVNQNSFLGWMSEQARQRGARIHTETTATSLIREDNRVIGVHTNRGCVYGDAVFVAEGAESEFIDREGFERRPPSEPPTQRLFVHRTIELDRDTIDERWKLGDSSHGAMMDVFTDPPIDSDTAATHARGIVHTNSSSVTVGMLCQPPPWDHDPGRVLDWFQSQPFVAPLIEGGEPYPVQARVRRVRCEPRPNWVDHGVAVGGEATGLGVSIPRFENTDAAVLTGRLFARAMDQLRAEETPVTRSALRAKYVRGLADSRHGREDEELRPLDENHILEYGLDWVNRALGFSQPTSDETDRNENSPAKELNLSTVVRQFPWGALLRSSPETPDHGDVCFVSRRYDERESPKTTASTELATKLVQQIASYLYSIEDPLPTRLRRALEEAVATIPPWAAIKWGRTLGMVWLKSVFQSWDRDGSAGEIDSTNREVPSELKSDEHEDNDPLEQDDSGIISIILYRPGYLESKEDPGSIDSAGGSRRTDPNGVGFLSEFRLSSGICRKRYEQLESSRLSALTVTQAPDRGDQKPGDTDLPKSDQSPKFDVGPDDPLAELGQRLRHQLGRWHELFMNRPTALTVDQHRWFMTLSRVATTTVNRMIETASPDREQFHSHLENLRTNLLTVQEQIARRKLTWAHGTVTQLLDHHLRWVLDPRNPSDPFPYPYQAFYRREQTLDSVAGRNSGATDAVRDFVLTTLSHFPHAELFGWEPELLSRLHKAVPNDQRRDDSSAETLQELGSLSADEDAVRELLELHPDEQRLWQEAGHYHVIGDLVEQWRQWSGQYIRFGTPDSVDQQVLRGRFLRELWTTRVLINRVHVRLMTGLPSERAVSLLRIRIQHVTRWIQESRFTIEHLGDTSNIDWPQPGKIQSEDPSSYQQQSIGGFPPLDSKPESHTTNKEEPIWNSSSDSSVDQSTLETLNRLASTVEETDSRSEYTNRLESHLSHLNNIEVQAMLGVCKHHVPALPTRDARFVAGLTAHAGLRILNRTPFCDNLLTWIDEGESIDRSVPFDLLQDLLVTYFDDFAETEEPDVHDQLVPIYRELRERIVATRDRLGQDVPRTPDIKPLCRLVDLAGHYHASLATHLLYPQSRFEELRTISRQRATVTVEQLGEELDQILDGIDHGITPPELRVVDEDDRSPEPQ